MSTFDQFISNYTGKLVDTDGVYPGQCMDLMHKYCQDVLGLPDLKILAAPAAKDVYLNFNNVAGREHFTKIDNTPTGVPEKGDIVFWGTGLGPFGHVAMFIQGDVNSFRSFDQNFPTGSKSAVTNHPSYKGVLGWLRFKPPVVVPPPTSELQKELDKVRLERDKNWNEREEFRRLYEQGLNQIGQQKKRIEYLESGIQSIDDYIEKLKSA